VLIYLRDGSLAGRLRATPLNPIARDGTGAGGVAGPTGERDPPYMVKLSSRAHLNKLSHGKAHEPPKSNKLSHSCGVHVLDN